MGKPRAPGPAMPMQPATPLHAYAPGEFARLTPAERGRALRRSKRTRLDPALTRTILTR